VKSHVDRVKVDRFRVERRFIPRQDVAPRDDLIALSSKGSRCFLPLPRRPPAARKGEVRYKYGTKRGARGERVNSLTVPPPSPRGVLIPQADRLGFR